MYVCMHIPFSVFNDLNNKNQSQNLPKTSLTKTNTIECKLDPDPASMPNCPFTGEAEDEGPVELHLRAAISRVQTQPDTTRQASFSQ